jgi:hypothetical protein
MLPIISQEVVTSVQKSMAQKDYLHDSWTEMMLENPQLFQTVTTLCKSFPDKKTKESFLRGSWLVWALFKSQDQANEMNKDWGI